MRPMVMLLIGTLSLFVAEARAQGVAPDTLGEWSDRLVVSAADVLQSNRIADHQKQFARDRVCLAFAAAGQNEQAIAFATRYSDVSPASAALSLIATAQAERDDVPGALETMEQIESQSLRRRALVTVIVGQAHRGNPSVVTELLGRLDDETQRNATLERVFDAYLSSGQAEAAQAIPGRVSDSALQADLVKRLRTADSLPRIGDPHYVDRMIARSRDERGFFGLSVDQEQLLRYTLTADVSLHHGRRDEVQEVLRVAEQRAGRKAGRIERAALLKLMVLYRQVGDTDAVRRVCERVLESYLNSTDAMDFDRMTLTESGFFGTLVDVISKSTRDRWIDRLFEASHQKDADHSDLISGIAGALAEDGNVTATAEIDASARSSWQRLQIAAEVVEGIARSNGGSGTLPAMSE